LAQIFRHQFILRGEVTVERHFVGAGRFGNRVDANRPDSMAVKEVVGGSEDARPGRNSYVFIGRYG
jgi:hypothetical protein